MQKHRSTRPALVAPFAALSALLIGGSFSPSAMACGQDDYIASVCVIATNRVPSGYRIANGDLLNIQQYAALYSLLGNTFGGTPGTNFALPDLRGKVIVGTSPQLAYGTSGGAASTTLNLGQLPAHNHVLAPGTASLANVTFTASTTGLTLMGNATVGTLPGPANGTLAQPTGPAAKIYNAGPPNVAMATGSIGGTLNGTIQSGTANLTGSTAVAGASQPVSTMPPYLSLNYFIAVNGIYPNFD
jgi:microcystin-dependent protein